jgi:hypothetical protein
MVRYLMLLLLCVSLFFISCTSGDATEKGIVSYIQDDRTGLCYAVLDNSITCVPCSYEVSYEAYFNYRGRYIHYNN